MERLVVTSHDVLIMPDQIPQYICEAAKGAGKGIKVERMLSMQEAIEEVEKQLLQRAYDVHKTTTKVAKALGISQPSASRKLRKHAILS
ncbi:helix-turn-helix domain-containing protein [Brevibacillus borstelensis]|nr:TyrR/PhhR family helix-turn-helix DNA-binding protein [Brevibacillus borstelensis]MED1883737.1 helix-turn-helix domain-containing protein [Brevibacillus borstelensis]GED51956.1 hypothetical protein BBO01nite_11970 [Brevibacillus borstelensis]